MVEPAGVAAAASRKAARGSSAARANDGTKADNATTPPTPLFAPSSMPDGDPWETPIPVVSPDVWHTPTGAAPTDRKVVALTFDDGPSEDTAAIVEILQNRGIPATFFIVGEQAKKRPEMVAELKAAGFALAAHSMTHPRLDELSESDAAAEVAQSIDLLNFGAGPGTVKCFRPPYGVWTLPTAQQVASRGVAMVNWTTDSTDYRRPDPETVTQFDCRMMSSKPSWCCTRRPNRTGARSSVRAPSSNVQWSIHTCVAPRNVMLSYAEFHSPVVLSFGSQAGK